MAAEVITPDLDEAAQLAGRQPTSRSWPVLAARELRASGARRVLLKTAESGAVLLDEEGLGEVPTARVEVVDETGAGDVFLAALAVSRLERQGWEAATRFANAASALSVSREGLSLPGRAEVSALARTLGGSVVRVP